MKKILFTILFLGVFVSFTQAQDKRLKVAGNIQSDSLIANQLQVSSGTDTTLLLGNGSSASLGTGLSLANGVLSSNTTSVEVNYDSTYIKSHYVRLTGDQSIAGAKTFSNVTSSSDLTIRDFHFGHGSLTNTKNLTMGYLILRPFYNNAAIENTAFGKEAMVGNTTGSYNSAIGNKAMYSNTTGNNNVAVGQEALYTNSSGSDNTAVGITALWRNTTGSKNVAIGKDALSWNTVGNGNTAVGTEALYYNQGSYNVGIGYNVMKYKLNGDSSIVIGNNQDVGSGNAVTGYTGHTTLNIGGLIFGTGLTGSWASPAGNIGIGKNNPSVRLDVSGNTIASDTITATRFIKVGGTGVDALLANGGTVNYNNLTNTNFYDGYLNGANSGQAAIGFNTFTPAALMEVAGPAAGAGSPAFYLSSDADEILDINTNGSNWVGTTFFRGASEKFFVGMEPNANNYFYIKGNGNVVIGAVPNSVSDKLYVDNHIKAYGSVSASTQSLTSDIRLKRDIQNLDQGMLAIRKLRPVFYEKKHDLRSKTYDTKEYGFLAQEVQKVLPRLVTDQGDENHQLMLNYTGMIPVLTKALQEQQLTLEAQEKRIQQKEKKAQQNVEELRQLLKELIELKQELQTISK